MFSLPQSAPSFSFDHLVSEVNTIVEDLRWLHLELTLRNRCNEILFQDHLTADELLRRAFIDLREKLGVLEMSIFMREQKKLRTSFRDFDRSVFWMHDRMPWMDSLQRWLHLKSFDGTLPSADVNHYMVNGESVASIAMPVIVNRECIAIILVVSHSSAIVQRIKKLLSGVAGSLGLSLDYLRSGKEPAGTEQSVPPVIAPHAPMEVSAKVDPVVSALTSREVIAHDTGMLLAIIDPSKIILRVNSALQHETGFQESALVGQSWLPTLIPEHERESVGRVLHDMGNTTRQVRTVSLFHIRTLRGTVLPTLWHIRNEQGDGCLTLIGSTVPPDQFESMNAHQSTGPMGLMQEARLSKHYRFLMKYVPFPVFHLDQNRDILRYANPAFGDLIGTRDWNDVPLGDFATLEIHGQGSDPRPCTVYVLSPNGITLSYRGFITSLTLFGKTIREVTLEPLE